MTNEITVSIALLLTTNWTGVTFNGKELGYVATNHIASVVYQGATNEYTMKTVASEIAKWRKPESITLHPIPYTTFTNNWIPL